MHDASQAFREEIVSALGAAPDIIEADRLHRFSTNGKRSDLSGWCKLFPDGRGGVYGCFRLGISETWTAITRERMTPSERAEMNRMIAAAKAQREGEQRSAWRKNADRVRQLLRECKSVAVGDPVHSYLCRRLVLERVTIPECVRIHPAMPYVHEGKLIGTFPAMVAPLMRKGELLALHRTYLDAKGNKAETPGPVRKLTPAAGVLKGASIPLYASTDATIGVAEGVETAMAAFHASGVPTVAAYSAGGVAGFCWASDVQRLVVFADHDEAGAKAAAELRQRAQHMGVSVSVMTPTEAGTDWCDVWASREAVHLEVNA